MNLPERKYIIISVASFAFGLLCMLGILVSLRSRIVNRYQYIGSEKISGNSLLGILTGINYRVFDTRTGTIHEKCILSMYANGRIGNVTIYHNFSTDPYKTNADHFVRVDDSDIFNKALGISRKSSRFVETAEVPDFVKPQTKVLPIKEKAMSDPYAGIGTVIEEPAFADARFEDVTPKKPWEEDWSKAKIINAVTTGMATTQSKRDIFDEVADANNITPRPPKPKDLQEDDWIKIMKVIQSNKLKSQSDPDAVSGPRSNQK